MAIESLAEEYAKFAGYLTETRVPFMTKKRRGSKHGGNSDIDVLGYNPKSKKTLIIEVKAWGGPNDYPKYTRKDYGFFNEYMQDMHDSWEQFKSSLTNHWGFRKLDEVWFVFPGYCEDADKDAIEDLLNNKYSFNVKIIPINELLVHILKGVKKDKEIRRKRYENPALEFCRWLLRSHEHGHFDLAEIDQELKGGNEDYNWIKKYYFRSCLKIARKNAKRRNKGINTRENALKALLKIKKATIPDLENYCRKMKIDLDYSRINVGLNTWIYLGIVLFDTKNKTYQINPEFVDIVNYEL